VVCSSSGKIAGFATDVFEKKNLEIKSSRVTYVKMGYYNQHIFGYTMNAWKKIGNKLFVRDVQNVVERKTT